MSQDYKDEKEKKIIKWKTQRNKMLKRINLKMHS